MCYLSGSSAYTSHDISTCRQLTRRDLDALQSRLATLNATASDEDPPEPFLVPGWDILEEHEEATDDQ